MKIEILISTMNKRSISELELDKKKIFQNCTIINQVTDESLELSNEEVIGKNIKMISYREKGLSKSRNRALENSTGDILLLTDDDIYLFDDTLEKIKENFEKNKEVAVITFKYMKKNIKKHKKYKNKEFIHNYNTIRKVSSVEIAIKRESVLNKNIKYDELFGLGSKYNSGEENIFLKECLDKGLIIKYIPEKIVLHPDESLSTPYYWTEEYIRGKGPLFYKLYRSLGYLYFILLILSKKKRIKNLKLTTAIILGLREMAKYKEREL